jgi:hypothetical protein
MKMDFDSEQMHRYVSVIKSLEIELSAFRVVYEYVVDSRRFSGHELMTQLLQARTIAQQEMDAKYGEVLETLANITDQASADRALRLLVAWTPKGRPN